MAKIKVKSKQSKKAKKAANYIYNMPIGHSGGSGGGIRSAFPPRVPPRKIPGRARDEGSSRRTSSQIRNIRLKGIGIEVFPKRLHPQFQAGGLKTIPAPWHP